MQPYLQYILLLGAVVIVGALAMPRKKQNAAIPAHSVQNMETALEQFMENMEKDNEELVQLVAKAQHDAKQDANLMEKRIALLERKCDQLADHLQQSPASPAMLPRQAVQPNQQAEALSPALKPREGEQPAAAANEAPLQTNSIHARYSELFHLYDQGKSIEAISKKLGMNKGEVQLILQLAKQEDAAHA
ncbi:DUF6115 domain-containing protein [Paenibacillus harenae]|uniref:DUF6115 domain-containing protein n=1 Tax=Paenibacillus harenae TaxID=306543 RepID=UPI000400561F|nr:hypothetical protein [Paenibacillus harenae]